MTDNYSLTIIVPAHNEVENLDRLESTLLDYFRTASLKVKALFVDDGSTDDSLEKIKQICSNDNPFEYISLKTRHGLSTAIKAGIDNCNTTLIGYLDADLQTTPFDFEKLLKYIDDFDAVVGIRTKRQDSTNKKIQSWIGNTIRRSLINDQIEDTGCPLKIIHSDIAQKIPFFDGMHRFIPALIQLQGGKVKQVHVQHFSRIAGTSKFSIRNRSIKLFFDTLAYRWMRSRYITYTIKDKHLQHEQATVTK